MNLADYKLELGSLLHDPSNVEFTATDITRWLNRAQLYTTAKTSCMVRIFSTSAVANQAEYTWPASALKILGVMYNWDNPLDPTSRSDLQYYDEDWIQAYGVTNPSHYHLIEKSRKIATYPPASSAADTTTLNGNHNDTAATTFTVASTSGFPSRGRIIIESEVIGYTNTTATTFTGCTRGMEDTTAATHADTTTVTLRDLAFWCVEKPNDLSVDGDKPWDGLTYLEPFHGILIPYCLYMAQLKNGKPAEARAYYNEWLMQLEDMRRELNKLTPERVYQYADQQPSEWPHGFGYRWPIQTS